MSDLEAIRSELARIRALEEKAPKGPWSHSAQTGPAGHCFVAQVWGNDGCSVAEIQTTADPAEATSVAAFTASARTDVPRLVKIAERALAVLEGHEPMDGVGEDGATEGKFCDTCWQEWPCDSTEALADIARLLLEE